MSWSITFEQQVQEVGLTFEYAGESVTIYVLQSTIQGGGDMLKEVYDPAGRNEQVLTINSPVDGGTL